MARAEHTETWYGDGGSHSEFRRFTKSKRVVAVKEDTINLVAMVTRRQRDGTEPLRRL